MHNPHTKLISTSTHPSTISPHPMRPPHAPPAHLRLAVPRDVLPRQVTHSLGVLALCLGCVDLRSQCGLEVGEEQVLAAHGQAQQAVQEAPAGKEAGKQGRRAGGRLVVQSADKCGSHFSLICQKLLHAAQPSRIDQLA